MTLAVPAGLPDTSVNHLSLSTFSTAGTKGNGSLLAGRRVRQGSR